MFCSFLLENKRVCITIGAIYRPPASSIGASLDHLSQQLQAARRFNRPVYLLGDVNLNVLEGGSSQIRNYNTFLDEQRMEQLVRQPTHFQPVSTALDHVITDQIEPAPEVVVTADIIGDHQPVIVRARLGRVRRPTEWHTVRSWRSVEWNAVCHDLLSDWRLVEAATNVNECVDQFMEIWDNVMSRHCPPRCVRVRRSYCPWLSDDVELRALMLERDAARNT